MAGSTEKRLFNRFDQYEIASVFTQTTEDYLSKKLKTSYRRFAFKSILGTLLFINAYLSHWGPWPWPTNYNFLLFSIVFYHVAGFVFANLNGINNVDGNLIGDFIFEKETKGVALRISKDCKKYYLEILGDKEEKFKTELIYTEYFTTQGYFLESKFRETLERFVSQVQKLQRRQ